MAVVLPNYGHIEFTSENEYKSHCQNDAADSGEESAQDETNLFTNDALENHEEPNRGDVSDTSMDMGESSDASDENETASAPLNLEQPKEDATTRNECNPKNGADNSEESSRDDYWTMDNTVPNELAEASTASIVDSILMDNDSAHDSKVHDAMELETNETTPSATSMPIGPELANTNTMTPDKPLYGGLENLGNTCYMASAIQLLCGLDSFPAELKSMVPPKEKQNESSNDSSSTDIGDVSEPSEPQSLREALLDVMERLNNGETVRPDNLKSCIDSRTSLFLGYHQQDSHEFLTTLLDIIDEDYKAKPKPEQAKTPQNKEADQVCKEDSDENDNPDNEMTCVAQNEQTPCSPCFNKNGERHQDENDTFENDDDEKSLESAQKRQKIDEDTTAAESANPIEHGTKLFNNSRSMQRSKSFTTYKFSDIESLLHDKNDGTATQATIEDQSASSQIKASMRQDEPKCKLAGGRMSTSGVELTRFVDNNSMDENVCSTGASLDIATPQQQMLENQDHETEGEKEEESISPVSSNFTTKVRVCLTCESCKFRRSHIETYFHLSLDIGTGSSDEETDGMAVGNLGCPSSSSIEEGLRKFFAPEKRDVKCEKCFHTSALQTSEITQLPKNMLFHLKRFIVDVSPDYSSISYRKDQSPVIFGERMELDARGDDENNSSSHRNDVHDDEEGGFQDFLALDCSYNKGAAYEIRSVVHHIGSSASCGHYTADAKRRKHPSEEEKKEDDDSSNIGHDDSGVDREWIRFNDSYVYKISSKQAVEDASQTAYMIMYELVQ